MEWVKKAIFSSFGVFLFGAVAGYSLTFVLKGSPNATAWFGLLIPICVPLYLALRKEHKDREIDKEKGEKAWAHLSAIVDEIAKFSNDVITSVADPNGNTAKNVIRARGINNDIVRDFESYQWTQDLNTSQNAKVREFTRVLKNVIAWGGSDRPTNNHKIAAKCRDLITACNQFKP